MGSGRNLPEARAVGGVERSATWRRARRRRILYSVAVVAGPVVCVAAGLFSGHLTFRLAPFAGRLAHAAIAFGIAAVAPLALMLAMILVPGAPDAERRARVRLILLFLLVLPAGSAGLAILTYGARQVSVYVDNSTDRDVDVEIVGHGYVGTAASGHAAKLTVPRVAMTLRASSGGETIEEIAVGGLEEILAGRYPAFYPDLEHDVADVFIWNLLGVNCYEESTKSYGSLGIGAEPTVYRDRVFVSPTDEPFHAAPPSVTVSANMPFALRTQLVRTDCR